MIGFQSRAAELELAKAVRAADIAAAEQYHLARTFRRSRRAGSKNRGGVASATRPVRPAAGTVRAPRRSSG